MKFTLKEPFAWFLDMLADPMAVAITARECVEKSHVNDPVLNDMLIRQRRTAEVGKRRDVIHEIQRHLARQQYYVHTPSAIYVGV